MINRSKSDRRLQEQCLLLKYIGLNQSFNLGFKVMVCHKIIKYLETKNPKLLTNINITV